MAKTPYGLKDQPEKSQHHVTKIEEPLVKEEVKHPSISENKENAPMETMKSEADKPLKTTAKDEPTKDVPAKKETVKDSKEKAIEDLHKEQSRLLHELEVNSNKISELEKKGK